MFLKLAPLFKLKMSRLPIIHYSFLLFLSFLLLPTKISKGCGPIQVGFKGYSFLNTELIDKEASYAPFVFSFDQFFNTYDATAVQTNANLTEWRERFCNLVKMEDLKSIIYKANIEDMRLLKTAINSEAMALSSRLASNSFAQHLKSNKCSETVDYLIFAKECEPHAVQTDPWKPPKRNLAAMEALIKKGKREFRKTKSHYIKLRYAYQLVRLAHYMKDYKQTLDLYDYLMPKIDNQPSILEYWIMGHKAGALMALGRNVEASYLYSLIFQNETGKRASAFRSFKINSDEEWRQCLLLCKDDHERATLYIIRANEEHSNTVEEMEHIYEYEPANENLELLLFKEIKKWERYLLGKEFNDNKRHNRKYLSLPSKKVGQKIIELQEFARKCRQEGLVEQPNLWHIAEGYLEFLAGDLYASKKTFDVVEDVVNDDKLREQLQAFRLALQIATWNKADEAVEETAAEIRRNNPIYETYKDFSDFMYDKLALLYQEANSPGKAFRCHYKLSALKPNPKEIIVEDLLRLAEKEEKTRLERYFIEDKNGDSQLNDIAEIRATLYLSEFQLEAALETLKKMDRAEWDKYGLFNPFMERLQDCVHCPLPDSVTYYNKGEVIERILDWDYQAKADPNKAAAYYYRIGVAFYNMSYFGYAWKVTDYYRSGASWSPWRETREDDVMKHFAFPYGNKENKDMSTALSYFERSRLLSKNPELAARATFMAANCEQKMYYTSKDFRSPCSNCIPSPPPEYLKYFDLLEHVYPDTDFYQEVIKECKYFRAYARR